MEPLCHVPSATGGQFRGTSPVDRVSGHVFLPPDNRLATSFDEAFPMALDLVEAKLPKGVVVTTSAIDEFYGNGLNLDGLREPSVPSSFMANSRFPFLARLLSFPMPTVALNNGHTFASGLIVVLRHDYRIQNARRGFTCMNEVMFGASMDPALLGIFRAKVRSPVPFRSLILDGHRFTAPQALDEGLEDGLGGLDET